MIVYGADVGPGHTSHPSNCHELNLNATTFVWLIVDQANNSRSRFHGTAAVTIDGVATSNVFTVEGIDGDRLTPRVPIWVVFLTNSNPFLHVHVDGMVATFTNNLDRPVVIDLRLPDFAA